MLVLKILLFPVWFPLWLLWKIFHGIAQFILSSVALLLKLVFLFVLILAIVVIVWLA
ncbi:MAG: hypothetical protein ACE5H0_09460 [Bacteroidota bacterium]